MTSAIGLILILVGIALEWVALHGYDSAEPGFKGVLEGLYGGLTKNTQ
jgi:hypothetical protein